ncbi:MAG: glycosyltransferase family 4 protein [Verrucomicrobia bacterium]|nr:glycosyltransferase family 4 protein [Verrucomicrobiota bacterium]
MKILFFSYAFAPDVGGLETVSGVLADRFARSGHQVRLITLTRGRDGFSDGDFPFEIIRRPSPRTFLEAVRWCDVYFQNNISLTALWPLLFCRRPWAVAHHSWLTRVNGRFTWRDRLKLRAMDHSACSIAVSRALANTVGKVDAIIGNPYDDRLFRIVPGIPREMKMVYLGRLIPGKGIDALFRAMLRLRASGIELPLTIVGRGPDEGPLLRLSDALGLRNLVTFAGERSGEELVRLLNGHEIMVVPSVYPESYGVVALEGIACGCVVAGTSGGGLPEAIGPCGLIAENGDDAMLAENLRQLHDNADLRAKLRREAARHLETKEAARVAMLYLALLRPTAGRAAAERG